jgi:hypothetical protein
LGKIFLVVALTITGHRESALTFADVVGNLRRYDQTPFGGGAPAIFVAEPWDPSSEAIVEWSGAKGGVPLGRKPILFYLTTVEAALRVLGSEYDDLVTNGETEAMCRKLAHHVTEMNAQRVRHDVGIERTNSETVDREFSRIGPNHASSTKGFAVVFHPAGGLDYVAAAGVMRVDTELYVKPLRIAIYRQSRSLKELDSARANEILTDIVRAMAFLGHATEVV